jgi:hypothetical protein
MSRTLIVGDLHTKVELLPLIEAAAKAAAADAVVFMGDYLDEWECFDEENLQSFEVLLKWAQKQEALTLLLGNHDIAYLDDEPAISPSGHHHSIEADVRSLIRQYKAEFKVATHVDGWLLTHAGLCATWAGAMGLSPDCGVLDAKHISSLLNDKLESRGGREQLACVGRMRGGWSEPGVLWADSHELMADPYPGINQIVGHTPIPTCTACKTPGGELLGFCDTFSVRYSGAPIGDRSMLLLDDGRLYKVAAAEDGKDFNVSPLGAGVRLKNKTMD